MNGVQDDLPGGGLLTPAQFAGDERLDGLRQPRKVIADAAVGIVPLVVGHDAGTSLERICEEAFLAEAVAATALTEAA